MKKHAAIGAIRQAIDLGFKLLKGIDEGDVFSAASELSSTLGGEVVDEVAIVEKVLVTEKGFDVGYLKLEGVKASYEVCFFNEYMTLERNGERLATFPDLIALINLENGRPITSAEASKGMKALLLTAPRHKLLLGAGLLHSEVYKPVEEMINKPIIKFIKDILLD